MTLDVQPVASEDGPGILCRRATGTYDEVNKALGILARSGVLVSATRRRHVAPGDPRVTVLVRVRNVPADSPRPSRRWVKPVTLGGTAVVVLTGLIIGGYIAAQQLVTAAAGSGLAALGLGAAVGVLVLLIGGRRKGVCIGLHCEGCGHR